MSVTGKNDNLDTVLDSMETSVEVARIIKMRDYVTTCSMRAHGDQKKRLQECVDALQSDHVTLKEILAIAYVLNEGIMLRMLEVDPVSSLFVDAGEGLRSLEEGEKEVPTPSPVKNEELDKEWEGIIKELDTVTSELSVEDAQSQSA